MQHIYVLWVVWSVITVAASRAAASDEIAIINLTPSGPDRELPIGKSFYLAGKAPATTTRVQPIIVRKGSNWLAGGSGPACTTLLAGFGGFRGADPQLLPDLPPGRTDASKLWLRGEGEALVAASWTREATSDGSFKLLVPNDAAFFRDGYAYCLYVFERMVIETSAEPIARAALTQYEQGFGACHVTAEAARRKCGTPPDTACTTEAETRLAECEKQVTDKLVADLQPLGDKRADALALLNSARVLLLDPAALRALLRTWRTPHDPTTAALCPLVTRVPSPLLHKLRCVLHDAPWRSSQLAFTRNSPLPHLLDIHAMPLARATAALLARSDALQVKVAGDEAAPRGLAFFSLDGESAIRLVGLRDSGAIDLLSDGAAGKAVVARFKSDELTIPNTAVTLRDLIELSSGRLRLTRYETIATVAEQIEPALRAPSGAPDGDLEKLKTFSTRVDALAFATRRAFAASTRTPRREIPVSADIIDRYLGEWLRADVAAACNPALVLQWQDNGVEVPPQCGDNPRAWPGYASIDDTPLDKLSLIARDIVNAHAEWRTRTASLTTTTTRTVRSLPIEAKIAFTQETWIANYLTPVVGYALLPGLDESLFYTGFQLHAFPNMIDEPQWMHGLDDIKRFVAIEVGFAPNADAFGPDGRFDGPWALPPLLFGATVHPLPYTSFSLGAVLADKRNTTHPQEKRERDWSFYIGLDLQANIPDLLGRSLGYGLKTKVEH